MLNSSRLYADGTGRHLLMKAYCVVSDYRQAGGLVFIPALFFNVNKASRLHA